MGSESPDVVLYDSSSNALAVQNGAAIPAGTPALLAAGSDGTNSRYILIDSSGRQIVAGAGTAGTPAGGVLTIQGIASGTAITISGTVTANIGTTNGLALDTTVAKLTIAQNTAIGSNTQVMVGGSVTTASPTYTTGNISALSLTTAGALRIDGSAVTQPVSGTITANAGTGNFAVVQATAANLNATVIGTVTANIGTTNGLALDTSVNGLLVTQTSTTSGQKGPLIQGAVTTVAPAYTTAQTSPLSLTTAGALRVDGSAVTQPIQIADVTATGALGALNATVQIVLASHTTSGFQLAAGTLIGTIVAEVSFDGGTTWSPTYMDTANKVSSIVFASANTATSATIVGVGGSGLARIRVSAYTSGTANITLRASLVNDPSVIYSGLSSATVQPPTAAQIAGWDSTGVLRVPSVKAGSTSSVVADQALVVTISPNTVTIPVSIQPTNNSIPNLIFGDITLSSNATTARIERTTYTEQTVNFTGSVKSSNAADAAAGTGARTLTIYYVDATGATAGTETVTLNGTTAVNLVTTTKCFIEKIIVNTVGSGGVNAGIISLFTGAAGTGTTVGTIAAGDNRTHWCHHYVLSGKTCNVTNVSHSNTSSVSGGTSSAHIRMQVLNSTNAAEIQISEFVDVGGAQNPSLKAYTSTIQIAGPARITMYVLPASNTATIYRGSIDCYDL